MRYLELNNEVKRTHEDGFFMLEKDLEAVAEFQISVDKKLMTFDSYKERIEWLIANDYYYPELIEQYSFEQLRELHDLALSIPFTWQSFMAISKFYQSYSLKTNDKKKYLENWEDRVLIVAAYLAQGNFNKAKFWTREMMRQTVQPATPTFLNSGRSRRGELISCFLLEIDDSLNSIVFNWATCAQLSKIGGGVSNNLSNLRAADEDIKDVEGAARGVMPVAKVHEQIFAYVDQMGQREGAGADYLNIFHADVSRFLDSKKLNADDNSRLQRLSIGLIIPSIFFEIAARNEDLYVFYPNNLYKVYGKKMNDIDFDTMYYELLANPKVRRKKLLNARSFLTKIATTQLESGYPYTFYKSNANRNHPLKALGSVNFSNLCTEIMQLSEISTINNYGEDDDINRDIDCTLASLNIFNLMKYKDIKNPVYAGMGMLTAVLDVSDIDNAPGINRAMKELNAVGLGAMNLAGYLAYAKIMYESEIAREFADVLFAAINYYSIEASMMIARERGKTFVGFEKTEYANGAYFREYIENHHLPTSDKVLELFEGIELPSPSDWARLAENVARYGLYHGYRLAIAPTQSIGYVQNATPSIMPIAAQIEARTYGDSSTYYPMPFFSRETLPYYRKTAFDMSQKRIIDMVATIQKHIDQGISCILFVPSDVSTEHVVHYIAYANYVELKSLYYMRARDEEREECITCSI